MPMQKTKSKPIFLYCLLIAAVYLTVCTKSSFLYPLNDWVDANIYFTIGKGVLAGKVPFVDLYDQKGPLVYFLYAIAALISDTSFIGVYVLEALSFATFLYFSYKLVGLYVEDNAFLAVPVLGALVLSAMSISHGGSLEEFCLAPFMYSLYRLMRYFRTEAADGMPYEDVLLNGALAGCILWCKFNLLAFYLAWMAMLFFAEVAQKRTRRAFVSCAVFLGGMAMPGLPILAYFILNNGLGALIACYFYNNIFGYSYLSAPVPINMLLAVVKGVGATMLRNIQYGFLIVLGVCYVTCSKKAGDRPIAKAALWVLCALTAFGTFMGGQGFRYYGIVLAVFAPFGLVPLLTLWNRFVAPKLKPKRWNVALPVAFTALGLGFCLLSSDNVYLLSYEKLDTPQHRFAARMHAESGDAPVTLLNYMFPDAGFYLAADVLPDTRYFSSSNMNPPDFSAVQQQSADEGRTAFVVTRNRDEAPSARYALIDTAELYYEEYTDVFRLYQRID